MNSFKQLIGLEFDSFYKIKIKEEGEIYTINDSIVIANKNGINQFQIFTDQIGISFFDLSEEDVHIGGDYDIEEVLNEPILVTEKFRIEKINCVWDSNQLYIIGFAFYSSIENFYFIRLSDEISIVNKDVFEQSVSKLKYIVITEK